MYTENNVKKEVMRVTNLGVHRDGITLMENVSFSVYEGEILSICGFHNTGKNILSRVLSGDLEYDCGRIQFFPETLDNSQSITRINDIAMLIPGRSISENLFAYTKESGHFIYHEKRANEQTNSILKSLQIPFKAKDPVDVLSRAQQHLLLVIKAIKHGKRIIVIENISFGYNTHEYHALLQIMHLFPAISFIYIINRPDPVVLESQRVICFRHEQMCDILFKDSFTQETLLKMLQGEANTNALFSNQPFKKHSHNTPILEIYSNSSSKPEITICKNEVVGILDLYGSFWYGLRNKLFLSGEYSFRFAGKHCKTLKQLIQRGLRISSGLTPEMLFPNMSMYENITLNVVKKCSTFSIINKRMMDYAYQQVLTDSQGNTSHRMQSLMRNVILPPTVLITENIMLGLDIVSKQQIAQVIMKTALKGTGILYISTSSDECFELCDRVLILENEKEAHWIECR